jgi:putative salt-induced outer membrane protein
MRFVLPLSFALLVAGSPAAAGLPEPVRAMIDAAIATGDVRKVDTVIEIAKATNPDEAEAIDALQATFWAEQAELAAKRREEEQRKIRRAGLFQRWKGKGELGGFRSTGNTDTLGLTGAIALDRKGIDWRHKLNARVDFQRSSGRTTREKFFTAYEPRYDVREGMFAYGLAQFESDRFQGFDARYALSGGLGAKVVDTQSLDLSVKAGPALRLTETTDGMNDLRLAGLMGIDFDWRITERLKLTQTTNAVAEAGGTALAIIDSRSTTLNLVTGLEAKVSDRLSTRFSYAIDYDSNPPGGKMSTDTISRFSFVYGF